MEDDSIPDRDHVARYCRGGSIRIDGKVSGVAFQLRPGEEYLSVDWLEFLNQESRESQIARLRPILERRLKVGAKAQIAVLNVGEAKRAVRSECPDGREVDFRHKPLKDAPSHSGIFGCAHGEDLISDLLARIISQTFPAKAVSGVQG
ncbi:hypothetical protein [Methylacidimicrobium tartarophylax]|uniref:Uncharacterized protein n=1 Tax=Methylacidimicrobium tartarophylax TaxID=1041768 RepID=A0A5E6MIM8_9BACT|nr:hypothetical protein [Methylacidimicrobium tartarophylax]VVM08198.1 hypothetical protein MAMT_02179 [Methylacidimicrobium tartarophylax]